MSTGARVESTDALKAFRVALIKFAENANVALTDSEAEIHRTLTCVEGELYTFWQGEIRKRTEAVSRAKDALRQKKMYKDSAGRTPSAVDEEKALRLAVKRLEEAEMKLANVKRWRGRLQKEFDMYKGSVQRFATSVQVGIPQAISRLDNMSAALESYLALSAPAAPAPSASPAGESSFSFAGPSILPDEAQPPAPTPPSQTPDSQSSDSQTPES